MLAARRWRRYPLACTVAWSHPYCFLGTPLLAADDLERAARALVSAPDALDGHPLVLETVRTDGPVAQALRAAADDRFLYALHAEQRAALERRPADDYVDGHRSGKRRREAKRLRNRLARDLGAPTELRDLGASPRAVEQFLALESAGWKGQEATALASDPAHAAFFREICGAPTATVQTHLLELGVPGRAAAMLFTLVAGDTAFAVKLAHDESLAAGAPGVQLMTDSAGWFHEQTTAQRFDSCASPDNPMINGLWPDRRPLATLAIPGTGVRGAPARWLLRTYALAQQHRSRPAEPSSLAADPATVQVVG